MVFSDAVTSEAFAFAFKYPLVSVFVHESIPIIITPFRFDDKLIPVPGMMLLIVDPDKIDGEPVVAVPVLRVACFVFSDVVTSVFSA